jgi:hypothetical protein
VHSPAHCLAHSVPPLERFLSQINPVHTFIRSSFKIRFNLILNSVSCPQPPKVISSAPAFWLNLEGIPGPPHVRATSPVHYVIVSSEACLPDCTLPGLRSHSVSFKRAPHRTALAQPLGATAITQTRGIRPHQIPSRPSLAVRHASTSPWCRDHGVTLQIQTGSTHEYLFAECFGCYLLLTFLAHRFLPP